MGEGIMSPVVPGVENVSTALESGIPKDNACLKLFIEATEFMDSSQE